jgi:hypothetical protein
MSEYGPDPICPHCKHAQRDSWELGDIYDSGGEMECGECCKTFRAVRNISVSWRTTADGDEKHGR